MTALVVALALGNCAGWVAVGLALRRVRLWMLAEDVRDADLIRGVGRLRGELAEARDELIESRRLLDWTTEQLLSDIEADPDR